ncbi:HK97 gp10 family phage protein [Sinorhizobium meliloti]|uniref:HK97 gp10 family phage protein n=1 Tax=Rhizobium meliloti TaxID=382 RepID=UPI0012978FCE|nr:HK97 gp10 family phage protein [Sinorhizobium meliloti]MQV24196.1 HK97 gp10 family phage protein [Sinorhizobium meliloti]
MATLRFSAQIAAWAEKVPEAVEAVLKESTKEIVREMQTPRGAGGRMRVDTGFLRASLMASTAAMPSINPAAQPVEGGAYTYNDGQIEAVIAGAAVGDTLYFGYTAAYAGHREYGANGQPPDAFVRLAVQNWGMTVERTAKKVKAAFGL